MGLHHVLTIVLIGACLHCDYTRSGCVIMLLHDINDVVMETAKICSYANWHVLANCMFVVFILCWIALRLIAFPAIIIKSTLFESVEVIGGLQVVRSVLSILFHTHTLNEFLK